LYKNLTSLIIFEISDIYRKHPRQWHSKGAYKISLKYILQMVFD